MGCPQTRNRDGDATVCYCYKYQIQLLKTAANQHTTNRHKQVIIGTVKCRCDF